MPTVPPRRKSRAVFWIAVLAIGSAIIATVLLANDARNLKALLRHYGLDRIDRWLTAAEAPPAVPVLPPGTKPKPTTTADSRALAPPHAFDPLRSEWTPSFTRYWKTTGAALCEKLNGSGLAVGRWAPSGFDANAFECSYETQEGKGADLASFFLIVRGTADGDIENVRLKVILPDTAAGQAFRKKLVDAVTLLVSESEWLDYTPALADIGRLENVTLAAFGSRLRFSHEFEDPRRFNFILGPEHDSAVERRTADYFDAAKWLQAPGNPPAYHAG